MPAEGSRPSFSVPSAFLCVLCVNLLAFLCVKSFRLAQPRRDTPHQHAIQNCHGTKRRKTQRKKPEPYPNSTVTSAPRPIPKILAAFPLFTHNSKNPLDPIIAKGSPAAPNANVANNFVISALPARIVNFASGAIKAGVSSPFKFVIILPTLASFSTKHLSGFPLTFGFGILNRTKSSINSPKLAVCQFFDSHPATGAKISRP